jgi:predicted GIY-YIG superfamily endonuclease
MEPIEIEALITLGAWYERYKPYRKNLHSLQHVFAAVETATGHKEPAAPEVAIYALIDPRSLSIRYIGISGDPLARHQQHIRDKANGFKQEWLDQLRQDGLVPIMRILEIVPSTADALEREKRWIEACIAAGLDILNAQSLPRKELAQLAQKAAETREVVSPEERARIVALAKEGLSAAEIATAMKRAGTYAGVVRLVLKQEAEAGA